MHILYFRDGYFYAYNFTGRNENDIVNLDNAEELSMHKFKCRRYYPSEKMKHFCVLPFSWLKNQILETYLFYFLASSFLWTHCFSCLYIYIYNHQIISYHQLFLIVSSNLQILQ